MASNENSPPPVAPKRRNLRLVILIVLVVLALGDAALLLYLHHHTAAHKASSVPSAVAPSKAVTAEKPKPVPNAAVKEAAPVAAASLPTFDIVRVSPQGNAVLAGRAEPGAVVAIKDGNEILGRVVADTRGEFVLLPITPLAPGMHEITLSETLSDGRVVEGVQSASIDLPNDGKSVLTVVSGPGGSQVVTGQGPQPGKLAMGAVDYDTHGHAIFSGTAPAGAVVTATLDGQDLGTARADSSGRWSLAAPTPQKPGVITLNGKTSAGAVMPSVSVPFAPEQLKSALTDGRVVIEPGDNLWMIARKVYGRGTMYTLIYSANAGQIHNPDLIFPGQNFVLPQK